MAAVAEGLVLRRPATQRHARVFPNQPPSGRQFERAADEDGPFRCALDRRGLPAAPRVRIESVVRRPSGMLARARTVCSGAPSPRAAPPYRYLGNLSTQCARECDPSPRGLDRISGGTCAQRASLLLRGRVRLYLQSRTRFGVGVAANTAHEWAYGTTAPAWRDVVRAPATTRRRAPCSTWQTSVEKRDMFGARAYDLATTFSSAPVRSATRLDCPARRSSPRFPSGRGRCPPPRRA